MSVSGRKWAASLLRTTASVAILTCPAIAFAQAEDQVSEEEEVDNSIIVTGSRIAGVAPVGATVTTLGRADFEASGEVTLDRLIQEVPQVFDLGFSENSRGQNGGNGNATFSNSINLRGLGPFSTLIITDGHRMSTNGRAINPSVLPTLGVERVEVIADGASAIYGSDAVAGVVNLIQRRNLDGVEAFGRIGSSDDGAFWEWNAGVALGKVFDRGQIMVAYEHTFRSNLSGDDRDFYASDQTQFGGPDYRTNQCSPGTLIYDGQTYALPDQFSAANASSLTAGTENRCDALSGMDLFPEQEYDSVNATATFEFADGVEFIFDGYFSRRDFSRRPGSVSGNLRVPESNAFFVAPDFYVPGTGGYTIAYSFIDIQPQDSLAGYQENWQVTPGIRADLFGDWSFEGRIGYGKATDRADTAFGVDFRGSLPAALASSDPATAFDPFGQNRTTDAAFDSIYSGNRNFPTDGELTTWQAGVNGTLFELPGGEAKLALGYEGQDFTMNIPRGTTDRIFNRKIHSGYAELLVPIFGGGNAMPGFEELVLTAAIRHDDYSDVGSTTNPKFGLNWVPADGFKLRASYGTSFRAPSFPEVNGNSSNLFVQLYQDPAGGGTVSGYTLGSGPNPDLQPESATTWTAGIDIDVVDNLSLSMTYFNISYKDTIAGLLSNLSVLNFADEYAGTGVILFGQAAFDRIIDVTTNGIVPGAPLPPIRPFAGTSTDCSDGIDIASCIFVDGRSLNLGRTKMNGIDFNASYWLDMGADDSLRFALNGTYLTGFDVAFTPGGDFVDLKNNVYQPLTFKARGSVTWEHGPITTRASLTHIGGYTNDLVTPNESVSSYTPMDLTISWQMADTIDLGLDSLVLTAEARNVFDVSPPYLNSAPSANGGGGYDPSVTSPIGRLFAISLRAAY